MKLGAFTVLFGSALRLAGYDDVLSIEHEDALLSVDEGFQNAVAFLRSVMPAEPALSDAWWT
jgi:AP endonuclease family 2 C terminus.